MLTSVFSLLEIALLVGLLYAPITIGLALSFRLLNYPDLTCEGSAMFGGAIAFIALHNSILSPFSLPLAFLAGAAAGVLTALLHVYVRVSRLLSGIISTAILYSVTIRLLGGRSNWRASTNTIFDSINPSDGTMLDIIVALATVILIFAACLVLFRSYPGRLLRALGDNERYVTSLGKNVKLYLIMGLSISNGIIGLGGGMLSHFKRVCDVNMSFGLLIGALAAMVLGETIYTARALWCYVITCLVGTFVYNIAIGVVYFSWGTPIDRIIQPSDVRMITGLLLIVPAVISLRLQSRYKLFNSTW
jgi:putative ABC transport system permease protein